MKSINSRNKGASGERELSALVHEHLGVKLVRNLEQSRGGGYDLVPVGDNNVADVMSRMAIECKRYSTVTPALLERFWDQASRQADQSAKTPVLAYREDRRDWRVVVPLYLIDKTAFNPEWATTFTWTAELSIEAFCALVRERAMG